MLGLIVLLTVFGSLADLARRQERCAPSVAGREPGRPVAAPRG